MNLANKLISKVN